MSRRDQEPQQGDDIEKLRGILLGGQRDVVEELNERLSNRYQRTQDVSEVLADAIRLSYQQDHEDLTEAMSSALSESVHRTVKAHPQRFAEALYPSIMPAIRRAIQEMSRQFAERVDELLTRSFSLQHLKWRIESWQTGMPLSSIIIRESIAFRVEQLLLIQNGSGLLLGHAYRPGAPKTDSAAISGMLWAIESFVRDSFAEDDEGLNRITMGEYVIYLVHGPAATLASVVQGVAPPGYFKQAKLMLETLHAEEHEAIADPHVSDATQARLTQRLQPLLVETLQAGAAKPKRAYKFTKGAVALATLVLLGVWIYHAQIAHKVQLFASKLDRQPGIIVQGAKRADGRWVIQGLYDPATGNPADQLPGSGIDPGQISFDFAPFVSLDPAVTLKRVTETLKIPAGVETRLSGGTLILEGLAPPKWYAALRQARFLPYGIDDIDTSGIRLETAAIRDYLDEVIGIPGSIQWLDQSDTIEISGHATADWVRSLQRQIGIFGDKIGFDIEKLDFNE